jgi:hypothetical protein
MKFTLLIDVEWTLQWLRLYSLGGFATLVTGQTPARS